MRCARVSIACLLACAGVSVRADYARPAPQRIDVAKDVYLFVSKPYGDVGLDGNSVAIVGRDAVLVFDTNGTPASAAKVLGEIRRVTDRPVRYVVYSHWHWDHWYGTQVYTAAFPGVKVIAHEKAKTLMAGPAIEFNRPGLEQQLPGYIGSLEQARAGRRDAAAAPRRGSLLPRAKAARSAGAARYDVCRSPGSRPRRPARAAASLRSRDHAGGYLPLPA